MAQRGVRLATRRQFRNMRALMGSNNSRVQLAARVTASNPDPGIISSARAFKKVYLVVNQAAEATVLASHIGKLLPGARTFRLVRVAVYGPQSGSGSAFLAMTGGAGDGSTHMDRGIVGSRRACIAVHPGINQEGAWYSTSGSSIMFQFQCDGATSQDPGLIEITAETADEVGSGIAPVPTDSDTTD
jgi:hypothetical protein